MPCCNTCINNSSLKKAISLALVAIMVAGGLTLAVPGMEPARAAQVSSNPNLRVSAEGQNADNEIGATNIVEVSILDNEIGNSPPIVTVDGNALAMYRSGGAWYGYFADWDIKKTGLPGLANCANICNAVVSGTATDDDEDREYTYLVRDAPREHSTWAAPEPSISLT